ncbi:MAG TPA: alpha/beta hydrolase [Kofleriaceae bacterium]|nr:alpha/beta hydrolase [Kofleriaceae bacterium]
MKHVVIVSYGLAALVACSDPAGVTVKLKIGDTAPAYGETPFPTDAVREGDRLGTIAGLDAIVGHKADLVTAHVAALDGFGLRPMVEFFVDGDLDPGSIPTRTATLDDAVGLVDVDPASPERGRVIAMDWRYDADRQVVAGATASGVVLREGTRYAAYVTTQLRAADGAALEPAPALGSLAAHDRWRTTADALAELGRDDVAGITVLTTQHASAPLVAARSALAELPPPVLAFDNPAVIFKGQAALDRVMGQAARATDGPRAGLERWGSDNPSGIAHDHVGVVATGTITIARFRGDDTKTELPDDETFAVAAEGTPKLVAIEAIPITIILPATAPPQAGYPVVIYGHGLGASRDQLLAFAEPLTSQGYALVGIDMFGHGSRFDPHDAITNMSSRPEFTGVVSLPDGFGDTTGPTTQLDFFEGFLNVAAVRDSIRQSALDLSRVVQLLRQPALDLSALGANARLDPTKIAYLGESFGTVVGTVFAAIEPDIDLYVLDVPGGGILDLILPNSPEISTLALPLIEGIYNPRGTVGRFHPLIHLMQAVMDGADPLTYAPHVLRDRFTIAGEPLGPRSLVAIEVVGDQVLSNRGTDALAQALGLAALSPHLDIPDGVPSLDAPASANVDGQTGVLVQYSPATHGGNWQSEYGTLRFAPGFPVDGDDPFPRLDAPVTIANPIYECQDQVAQILASHRTGVPVVPITKAPVADFDGDGVPDATDAHPVDPTQP